MKTTFKPSRGHVFHVIHESKTGGASKSAWSLCGNFYENGERGYSSSCLKCCQLDNPLFLSIAQQAIISAIVQSPISIHFPEGAFFQSMMDRDYVDGGARLTRRGNILAEDFRSGPVLMHDLEGVAHARIALSRVSVCGKRLPDDNMTTEHYAKLRVANADLSVTCLNCVAL